MRVLFVYPNVTRDKSPQLGICSIAAIARQLGNEVDLWDLTTVPRGREINDFQLKIKSFEPDLLTVSCRSNEWRFAHQLFHSVDTGKIIKVFGGPHATVAPKDTLEIADLVVLVEGEQTFKELLIRLASEEDITNISGCWCKRDGQVIENEMRDLISNPDTLPIPYWRIFSDIHYESSSIREHFKQAKVVGAFEGSRGCPFACTYCTNDYLRSLYKGKGKWRREKSPKRIVQEMKAFREDHGLDFVYWIDEVMLTNVDRLKELRDLYKAEIGVPFLFMERPENMTDEKVGIIKEAGAWMASIGIESGDEKLRRDLLNRSISQQGIISAFRMAEKHGLRTHAFTMIGFPNEDSRSTRETFKLLKEAQPNTVQATIFFPLTRTILYEKVVAEGLFDPKTPMPDRYYHESSLDFSRDRKKELLRCQYLLANYRIFNLTLFSLAQRSKLIFLILRLLLLPRELPLIYQTLRQEGIFYTLRAICRRILEIFK